MDDPIKYSLSTWNHLKSFGKKAELYPILESTREKGLGVELWLDWFAEPALFSRGNWSDFRERCLGHHGLCAHSQLMTRFEVDVLYEEIDLCQYIGADPLAVHPRSFGLDVSTLDIGADLDSSSDQLDLISDILDYSAKKSVRLALENGQPELLQKVLNHSGDGYEHKVPGQGSIDWNAVMKTLDEIGFGGQVVLELASDRADGAAEKALKFLRSIEGV